MRAYVCLAREGDYLYNFSFCDYGNVVYNKPACLDKRLCYVINNIVSTAHVDMPATLLLTLSIKNNPPTK